MWHKLDNVLKAYLIEIGHDSTHELMRYRSLAIAGIRDINDELNVFTKTIRIKTNKNKFKLPSDFVDFLRLGVLDANGRMCKFTYNSELVTDPCGDIVPVNEHGGYYDIYDYNQGRINTTANYDTGIAHTNGRFMIDRLNNMLYLSGNMSSGNIVMEYLSDFDIQDGDIVVHQYWKEALLAYVKWASVRNLNSTPLSRIDYYNREYYRLKSIAYDKWNAVSPEDILFALRDNFKQTPKV